MPVIRINQDELHTLTQFDLDRTEPCKAFARNSRKCHKCYICEVSHPIANQAFLFNSNQKIFYSEIFSIPDLHECKPRAQIKPWGNDSTCIQFISLGGETGWPLSVHLYSRHAGVEKRVQWCPDNRIRVQPLLFTNNAHIKDSNVRDTARQKVVKWAAVISLLCIHRRLQRQDTSEF